MGKLWPMRNRLMLLAVLCGAVTGCGNDEEAPALPDAGQPTEENTTATDQATAEPREEAGPLHFTDLAPSLELPEKRGTGAAIADLTGDGWDEVIINAYDVPLIYKNDGAGNLSDWTWQSGVFESGIHSTKAVVPVDVDGDGDLDLYFTRADFGDVLLLNDGKGHFKDGSKKWGMKKSTVEHEGVSFGDLDGDGDLDAFVAVFRDPDKVANQGAQGSPNFYYRNMGDHFVEAGAEVGLRGPDNGETFGAILFDADDDGDQDMFIVHDIAPDEFMLNDGQGHFAKADESWMKLSSTGLMGLDVGDVDGDGELDIYATNFGTDQVILKMGPSGRFKWEDHMEQMLGDGVNPSLLHTGWGCALIDMDNDGDQDAITVAAFSDGIGYDVNLELRDGRIVVLENLGWGSVKGSLVEATERSGSAVQRLVNGFGLAVGDWDRDGDLDVAVAVDHVAETGGQPIELGQHRRSMLLRNDSVSAHKNNSLTLRLRDPNSKNRFAVGARVDVVVGDKRTSRVVTAGASYLSAHSMALHFGLGKAEQADSVRVTWPWGKSVELGPLDKGEHTITR